MKYEAAALLCAAAVLLAGCGKRGEPAPAPAPTPAPTAESTAAPSPTPTPAPTPSPTPTPEPTPYWEKAEEKETCLLFVGKSAGGRALGEWLMGEGAGMAAAFVPEKLTEPLFTLYFTPREDDGNIPKAAQGEEYILLAADAQIARSGLLELLLPVFEREYGYVVEVCTGDAANVQDWAGPGSADAALLSESGAKGLNRRGFSGVTAWADMGYILKN